MAEVVPTIPAGSSAEWSLKIKNQDGTPADPTIVIGFAVFLFDQKGKQFKKYSSNNLAGFIDSLTVTDGPEGEIRMPWEGSETKTFPPGEIYWQYMEQLEDSNFPTDGKFTAKTLKKRLCIIEDTESKHSSQLL
ncbi:MAG TPA: hypothetical protein PKD91_14170 [Bacteroidia bacterium]|nr:hypothetical protein [Bacteroidia bacterium]